MTATALKSHTRATSAKRPGVTVIVPCCDEAEGLAQLAHNLENLARTLSERYEPFFLLIDDGSRDETWNQFQRHFGNRPEIRLLRHAENRGLAATIATGMAAAETEIVCSIDADCTYDPQVLAKMIPLLTDDVALVTASPYHPQGAVENVAAWRLFLSRGASRLYRVVLGRDLHTYTSCFRVYRRSVVRKLTICEAGFLGVAELLALVVRHGHGVVEYPTVLTSRRFGRSKMKIARTVLGHLRLLTRLAWRSSPPTLTPSLTSSRVPT